MLTLLIKHINQRSNPFLFGFLIISEDFPLCCLLSALPKASLCVYLFSLLYRRRIQQNSDGEGGRITQKQEGNVFNNIYLPFFHRFLYFSHLKLSTYFKTMILVFFTERKMLRHDVNGRETCEGDKKEQFDNHRSTAFVCRKDLTPRRSPPFCLRYLTATAENFFSCIYQCQADYKLLKSYEDSAEFAKLRKIGCERRS